MSLIVLYFLHNTSALILYRRSLDTFYSIRMNRPNNQMDISQCSLCAYFATYSSTTIINTLGPRQNGRHFADDMFKCIFLNENIWIPIEISVKFVSKGSINNNPALFQIMAWRRPGDKPLSEPMVVSSLTHICVTRPQRVNCPAVSFGLD